jgi:hypothetical protein
MITPNLVTEPDAEAPGTIKLPANSALSNRRCFVSVKRRWTARIVFEWRNARPVRTCATGAARFAASTADNGLEQVRYGSEKLQQRLPEKTCSPARYSFYE